MTLKTELLPYQRDAVNKLKKIKVGALYMEQGTGKTRTALELIAIRYNKGKVNHILWLCPNSVKPTIEKEIEKHADGVENLTVHGIQTLSSSIKANRKLLELVSRNDVFLVVDESNLVKNHKAKRTERITKLAQKCKYKLILNGTPVSRDETDLFAQWYILDWRILGYKSFWSFAHNHVEWDEDIPGKIRRTLNVDYLTRKIAPYTYQITKDEALDDLPIKTHREFYYDIPYTQRLEYERAADALLFQLDELKPYTIYRLLSGLQNVISGFKLSFDINDNTIKTPLFDDYRENPRLDLLLEVIERYEGKSIIFCKYRHEINAITEVLNELYGKEVALRFDGSVPQSQRQMNIEKFEKDARFLVAHKATAGYGLNLQFCSNIIFYSNDWDLATRLQAEDRVYRIGQKNKVSIIDICARDTIDERILRSIGRKENLVDTFKTLIDKMKDKEEIKKWLHGDQRR